MTLLELILIGIVAGFLGSITGLGGSILLLPALTLLLKVPFPQAAGASLLAVIATSSGAAVAFVRDRTTNIRIGMSLEGGTTLGALLGALLAGALFRSNLHAWLYILFGIVLLSALAARLRRRWTTPTPDLSTERLNLRGSYYDALENCYVHYFGIRWFPTELLMVGAGFISGLLGLGSGTINVVALNRVMRLPLRVCAATSNFMIGVTGLASAAIYWRQGYIDLPIAGATCIGVLIGALPGSRLFPHLHSRRIRFLFTLLVALLAIQMIAKGTALL